METNGYFWLAILGIPFVIIIIVGFLGDIIYIISQFFEGSLHGARHILHTTVRPIARSLRTRLTRTLMPGTAVPEATRRARNSTRKSK